MRRGKKSQSPRPASVPRSPSVTSHAGVGSVMAPPVPRPSGSIVRDAAAVAGGVAVGSALGNIASSAITGLFGGRREVAQELPRDYAVGRPPSGPCAYEIAQFLQCVEKNEDLSSCEYCRNMLRECKRYASYNSKLNHAPKEHPRMIVYCTPRQSPASETGKAGAWALGDNHSKLLSGQKLEDVKAVLPPNYNVNAPPPSGPCTFHIANYLRCAYEKEDLDACNGYKNLVRRCLKENKLDFIPPCTKD